MTVNEILKELKGINANLDKISKQITELSKNLPIMIDDKLNAHFKQLLTGIDAKLKQK